MRADVKAHPGQFAVNKCDRAKYKVKNLISRKYHVLPVVHFPSFNVGVTETDISQ
jgi:hypothetical protein